MNDALIPVPKGAPRPGRAVVLVSILNWNGLADTLECLSSIAPGLDSVWDVVVIDNGSSQDPREELAARFPSIECIRASQNTGFTGGQNQGMQLAIERGYEAVLLLNNDCEISGDAINELLGALRSDTAIAAVSPLIYCSDNRSKPQIVAAWFDWAKHQSVRPSAPDAARPDSMPSVVPGTALMFSCMALKKIGLLDNRYFAYYEDNDISARIAKSGMTAIYCRTVSVWHRSRPTHCYSEMALYLSARNTWLFWRTHTPAEFRRGMFRHLLAQSLYEIALLKKAGTFSKCAAVVAGFWDAQRNRYGPPPQRFRSPALLAWLMCFAPYLSYELLSDPLKAIKLRWRGLLRAMS